MLLVHLGMVCWPGWGEGEAGPNSGDNTPAFPHCAFAFHAQGPSPSPELYFLVFPIHKQGKCIAAPLTYFCTQHNFPCRHGELLQTPSFLLPISSDAPRSLTALGYGWDQGSGGQRWVSPAGRGEKGLRGSRKGPSMHPCLVWSCVCECVCVSVHGEGWGWGGGE